jgi:hypothetical protein
LEEIDIWRSAQQMIAMYGEDAAVAAAMRFDEFRKKGDREAIAVWIKIIAAIHTLEDQTAPKYAPLN